IYDPLRPTRSRDIEDVGGTRGREREDELPERQLLDPLQLQLDRFTHPTGQPMLERLRQEAIDRLECTQPLLRDATRLTEVVCLEPLSLWFLHRGHCAGCGWSVEEEVDLVLGESVLRHDLLD